MNIRIFDIETNPLPNVTKIHCLSYFDLATNTFESFTDYEEIRRLFLEKDIIWVGHNIVRFDIPVLVKILGITTPKFVIDTLAISWYLYPERKKHGLEEWGVELGTEKPKIEDWSNLNIEEYIHRCEGDVKINYKLWCRQKRFLERIYQDEDNLEEFLKYLHFKLDCVRVQEQEGLAIDVPKITQLLSEWQPEKERREKELEDVMPQVARTKKKKYENTTTDLSGNLFTKGDLFFDTISENRPISKETILSKIVGWEDPNSSSHAQIKEWLYKLGWIPQNIKHERNKKTSEVKLIPQIKSKTDSGELCPSVKLLFEKEPKLAVLEGLFVLSHRITILKAFMKDQVDGIIYPSMAGLTNTLRLKHKTIVNLPAVSKDYGKDIRGCIIAKPGRILVGADLANIEDRTKRHYIYFYDPEYVETMNTPGYDAHLEIGVLAEFFTQEDADWYKWYEKQQSNSDKNFETTGERIFLPSLDEKARYVKMKGHRNKAKITNFSATYKVGAEALSRNANIPLKEAKKLLKIYWERNSAILDIEDDCLIREVGDTRWLQNPISKFWYSLRSDKDKFSTLNQGSAVFIFDMWIKEQRELGLIVPFQYHDEDLLDVLLGDLGDTRTKINLAMDRVNEKYPLNVSIGCSIQVGQNYADTH